MCRFRSGSDLVQLPASGSGPVRLQSTPVIIRSGLDSVRRSTETILHRVRSNTLSRSLEFVPTFTRALFYLETQSLPLTISRLRFSFLHIPFTRQQSDNQKKLQYC
ncbi:hypothetical protein Hdeb2414_s0016g00495881 [Helianthus debilis subsp. tardiflorus]